MYIRGYYRVTHVIIVACPYPLSCCIYRGGTCNFEAVWLLQYSLVEPYLLSRGIEGAWLPRTKHGPAKT